jgi:mannose-6-phosphate isomerase
VKWLDCDALLSVQVHPSDALARKLLNESRGKTEAWIILHAEPEARIYAGLKPGVDPAQLEARMQDGSVAECLHSFRPRRGDVVFIPAGTVHAAGGGIVMAEVQQTSDATFRMFDWNRMGTDGRPRQLHQSQALECIDWSRGPVEPTAWIDLDDRTQSGVRRVLESDYFRFDVVDLASDPVVLPGRSVTILMALSGDVEIEPASQGARLRTGATCLLPPRTEGWSVAAASNGGACCLRVEPVASPDA